VVVPSGLVATLVVLASTSPSLESVVDVETGVVVASTDVLIAASSGVLEALLTMRAVDVEATRSGGVVVESVETGGDEDAATCAEASRISKMLANPTTKRRRRPIPATAMMFVFILFG
jgi:hypothetical protein